MHITSVPLITQMVNNHGGTPDGPSGVRPAGKEPPGSVIVDEMETAENFRGGVDHLNPSTAEVRLEARAVGRESDPADSAAAKEKRTAENFSGSVPHPEPSTAEVSVENSPSKALCDSAEIPEVGIRDVAGEDIIPARQARFDGESRRFRDAVQGGNGHDPASKRNRAVRGEIGDEDNSFPPLISRPHFPSVVLDMETAVAALFPDRDDGGETEALSNEDGEGPRLWVRFRAGHAGDASELANLCRRCASHGEEGPNDNSGHVIEEKSTTPRQPLWNAGAKSVMSSSEEEEENNLELRLSGGFGDEVTPPAFHAILAEIYKEEVKSSCKEGDITGERVTLKKFLGGAAIISPEWDAELSERVLRAECVHIDQSRKLDPGCRDLLRRRLVLRLSTLGLATGCAALRLPNSTSPS